MVQRCNNINAYEFCIWDVHGVVRCSERDATLVQDSLSTCRNENYLIYCRVPFVIVAAFSRKSLRYPTSSRLAKSHLFIVIQVDTQVTLCVNFHVFATVAKSSTVGTRCGNVMLMNAVLRKPTSRNCSEICNMTYAKVNTASLWYFGLICLSGPSRSITHFRANLILGATVDDTDCWHRGRLWRCASHAKVILFQQHVDMFFAQQPQRVLNDVKRMATN